MDWEEIIRERIEEYKKQKETVRKNAESQLTAYDGAIQGLEGVLATANESAKGIEPGEDKEAA